MRAFIYPYLHLGDKITCCLALYNLAIRFESEIDIYGCELVKDIVRELNFDRLFWKDHFIDLKSKIRIGDFFYFTQNSKMPFFTSYSLNIDFHFEKLENIILPNNKNFKNNLTLFQFDSKSPTKKKKNLSLKEAKKFVKEHADFPPKGIGGYDTIKVLPYDYELGNISKIISIMKTAKQFVGVDSGMSHVAGVLRIPSKIYLLHKEEFDIRMVEEFYKTCYPSTECFHDFSLGKKMRFKIF